MLQRLVVELDALLDTRLGTIAGLYPDIAKEIVTDPELFHRYQTRRSDEFARLHPGINNAAYQIAYENRDVNTLKRSTITEMVPFLSMLIQEMERAEITGDAEVDGAEIIINTWPYQLTADETYAFQVAVLTRAGLHTPITSVHLAPHEMTTSRIAKEKWVGMISYSLDTWLRETFRVYPKDKKPVCVPASSFITPGLLITEDGVDDPTKRQMPNGDSLDPFIATKWNFAELIGIVFTPPSAFCLLDFRTGCLSDPERLKSIVTSMTESTA